MIDFRHVAVQEVSTVVINVISVFRKTLINNRLCRHLCGAV